MLKTKEHKEDDKEGGKVYACVVFSDYDNWCYHPWILCLVGLRMALPTTIRNSVIQG
jgi:hypothetical protein